MYLKINDWNIEALTGYKPKTTFYTDFSIADNYGIEAIKDTYNRAFNDWKTDTEYLTEFCMVLNWKIWEHYETDKEKAALYEELYYKTDAYILENFKDEALAYYFNTTD